MSNIIPFQFDSHEVRVITDDQGEPLFVGKDLCDALGYGNHSDAIAKHCKGVAKRYPLQTAGGVQEVRVLAEGDMFRLIVGSRLPAAERFERLVFDEILPTIRKTGSYSRPPIGPVPTIQGRKFLIWIDREGKENVEIVPEGSFFTTHDEVLGLIRGGADNALTPVQVAEISRACMDRLMTAVGHLTGATPRVSAPEPRKGVRKPSIETPLDRLVRYVRNSKKYARDRKFTDVLRTGLMPYAKALKLMKTDADTFRLLVCDGVEAGVLVLRHAPGYSGEVLEAV